jgi:hypothetical protein
MPNPHFEWTRFWSPSDYEFSTEDGFLKDPRPEGKYAQYDVFGDDRLRTLDELSEVPCLILLGEPGIGKSEELSQLPATSSPSHSLLQIDLGEILDGSDLKDRVLRSEALREWKESDQAITLILDALDECQIQVENVAKVLKNRLFENAGSSDQIRLRIACRSASWPSSLTSAFSDFWGEDQVKRYQLTPLRKKDVLEAAEKLGIAGSDFLGAVEDADAGPLAAVPLSLGGLLRTYQGSRDLPVRKRELFEQYVLKLCEEQNPDRIESGAEGATGILDPKERVAVLARIAAQMVFSNRNRVLLQTRAGYRADSQFPDQNLLFLDEVTGGTELYEYATSVNVTSRTVEDAVSFSGLLNGSPETGFRWLHRTFAEFLAARFVDVHQMEEGQIRSLLEHDYDQELAPQLRNVIAWLSAMGDRYLQYVARKDPSIALDGDILEYDAPTRQRFLESLFGAIQREEIEYSFLWNQSLRNTSKLTHPDLAVQVRERLQDAEASDDVIDYALQIARDHSLSELSGEALNVAKDSSRNSHVRAKAVRFVDEFGSDEEVGALRPLAVSPDESDESRRVAYESRIALLPDKLSFTELIEAIEEDADSHEAKRHPDNWYYELDRNATALLEQLSTPQLHESIQWTRSAENLKVLAAAIPRYALKQAHNDTIAAELADLILRRLEDDPPLLEFASSRLSDLEQDHPKARKNLLKALISNLETRGLENDAMRRLAIQLGPDLNGFWVHQDTSWFIDELASTNDEKREKVLAAFIGVQLPLSEVEHIERIWELRQNSEVLRQVTAGYFEAWKLDSERSERVREAHSMERNEEDEEEKDVIPIPQRIRSALEDPSIVDRWSSVTDTLRRNPQDPQMGVPLAFIKLDIYKAWEELSDELRDQILDLSLQYLESVEINTADWWQPDLLKINRLPVSQSALLGMKALWLLHRHRPEVLQEKDVPFWQNWAPVCIAFQNSPRQSGSELHDVRGDLIGMAYEYVPERCLWVLEHVFSAEPVQYSNLRFSLDDLISEKPVRDVVRRAATGEITPEESRHNLLRYLVRQGDEEALSYVISKLATGEFDPTEWIAWLLLNVPNESWERTKSRERVMQLFLESDDVAEETIKRFARQSGRSVPPLPTGMIRALYLRLYELFPEKDDPKQEFALNHAQHRMSEVSQADQIRDLRRNLPRALTGEASPESIEALRDLSERRPDDRDWSWFIRKAKHNLRSDAPPSIDPQELLRLARDASQRIARTNSELQRVILESLDRLQSTFDAQEQPAREDLWNAVGYGQVRGLIRSFLTSMEPTIREASNSDLFEHLRDGVKEYTETYHVPVDEGRISDYLARHLRSDLERMGVATTRESELRREDRPDLLVKVPSRQDKESDLRVVIEVKGSWNSDLLTSIRTQLQDRYQHAADSDFGSSHAIYFVSWFDLEKWSESDESRLPVAKRHGSPEEIQAALDERLFGKPENIESFVLEVR